ncbi:MAG: hypothetical protein AB8B55_12640 [Mariniblastus sp.]
MKLLTMTIFALFLLPAGFAVGQKESAEDGPVGIFSSRAEYSQFMGGAKRAAYGEGGSPELQAMIPMLNDIALNKPVGWTANEYGTTGSTLGLLSNEAIRADLEMVDSQYKELQDLSAQVQKRAAEQIRGLDFSNRDNLVSQIQKIRDEASEEVNAVLLPQQLNRLKQIRMQALLQQRGFVEVLTSNPVKSDLEITDQQSDELKEYEKIVQEDLAKEIAKLQEKARDRILSKLNPTQKKQAKEMIGDAFEFKNEQKNAGQKKKAKRTGGKGK